ncbi:MAG: ROK family protein, partial [Clostridia bacterium]|nr:ROK family protein [Clostridia bacterium]
SPVDEWSKDFGVGAKYFSQDGVIRLAELAGVTFNDGLTQAEKLKVVQDMAKAGDMCFERIFKDIGIYLGYAITYYANFYQIEHVLLLGRALVGGAGRLVKDMAERVLSEEFPKLNKINIILPDDNKLKLEQSAVAATLTQI